jgi:hypothetical protein
MHGSWQRRGVAEEPAQAEEHRGNEVKGEACRKPRMAGRREGGHKRPSAISDQLSASDITVGGRLLYLPLVVLKLIADG